MSWKSKIYQAFLIVCFATLCYSRVNVAHNKYTKLIKKTTASVDGDLGSHEKCSAFVCELVVDLGAPHVVKHLRLNAFIECNQETEIVYKVGLRKNKNRKVFDYHCRGNNPPYKEPFLVIDDEITCGSKEAFQFVFFESDLECTKLIYELQVFGSNPYLNLALYKNAEVFSNTFWGVDGDSCGYIMCKMVVDLGEPHVIESVEVKADVQCKNKSEIVYKVGLMEDKKSAEFDFTCPHNNHHNEELDIVKITCDSEEAFQFVVFSIYALCSKSITEFQVFGLPKPLTHGPTRISSSIGSKMDENCYLTILFVVFFSSGSWVYLVFVNLLIQATNPFVVKRKGKKNLN